MSDNTHLDSSPAAPIDPRPWRHYKVAGQDQLGSKIEKIIHTHPDYTIYFVEDGTILDGLPEVEEKLDAIAHALSLVRGLLPDGDSRLQLQFKYQLAKAMRLCASNKPDEATQIMDRILARFISSARMHYLWAAFSMSAFVWLAVWVFVVEFNPTGEQLLWLQAVALGGSGGVFSVALHQGKIPIDLNHGTILQWTTGASRVVVAILAAIACLLSIKGGIFLALIDGDMTKAGYSALFFCFLAGFSETFVPNILRQNDSASSQSGTDESVVHSKQPVLANAQKEPSKPNVFNAATHGYAESSIENADPLNADQDRDLPHS